MTEQYLPKEQLEAAQKLTSSEIFRAIERVLTARKPDHPNPADPMSRKRLTNCAVSRMSWRRSPPIQTVPRLIHAINLTKS